MPAVLRLSQSLPAVGMNRSPDPMSTRIRSLSERTKVTFVGELYCSPACPAALSRSSSSGGDAPGARKLVGNTRWPSLTTVTSNAPCLNENGEAAKVGRAYAARPAAVLARRARRLNFGIGGQPLRGRTAFYANATFLATEGEFRSLRRRCRLTLAVQAAHEKVDDRQNQSQSDQALCRHATRELRDVIGHLCHEHPRALPEDQIDQHDRENGDEAELDDLPQDLCCVGHEFAHGKNPSMTHTSEGGELGPPPGLRLAKLIRPPNAGVRPFFGSRIARARCLE